ncbi:high-affinity choline transporter 1-like isoform X2 [Penaeus monodon]|uniref:high-affinity choline transporter 1-like isoform X2 n=1 Tax=Penaeus monodon TaxID=6687 RepID=UPI0018A756A2|nr:high-affinity choline transporter 1-like isoform X2 [Penaeus monodon]
MTSCLQLIEVRRPCPLGRWGVTMLNIPGLAGIIVFYLAILGIGVYAAWKRRDKGVNSDEVMLAGRSIGSFVGVLTMTATWVGGGYINGSAEKVFDMGLIWCQAPFGYAISLSLGGAFFASHMRKAGYVTMLDPLQNAFGRRMGGLLYFPALMGETFWSAAILSALGSTLSVILDIGNTVSIIVSAAIAVAYTLFGGLYSVAYTDVVQLFCIFMGLWLTVPFAMTNEAVGSLALNETNWLGSIEATSPEWGLWIDYWLLLICGGIPWQVYFQRVLSAKSPKQAKILSYAASFGCILSAVPACLIGAIAKATDWSLTDFERTPEGYEKKLVLPLVMQHLTPAWVAFLGLGAVSAAVMSSADSSVLSASSMFARNIYKNVFRQQATEREVIWVMRIAIVVVAIIASTIGILINSIYYLFKLCGDLVYVILFPQLLMVVHFRQYVNTYGSFAGFCMGFLVRLLGGEPYIGVPAVIHYPFYDAEHGQQNFPFRTVAMLVSLTSLILISAIAKLLFTKGIIPEKYDFCHCFTDAPSDEGEDKQELSQDDTLHVASLKKEQSSLQAAEGKLYMPSASIEDGHVNKM